MRRILFIGQKPIGEKCFKKLVENQNENYQVIGSVSNISKEDVWWKSNNIYGYCKRKQLGFVDNEKSNEDRIIVLMRKCDVNYIISVGHKWILSKKILEYVKYQAVNLHLAKLPEYKGNYTYNHAILNGEKEYGVTLHWMVEKVDEGDYIFTDQFEITDYDTAYSLYQKSNEIGEKIFDNYIDFLKKDKAIPRREIVGEGKFYSKCAIQGLREIRNISDKNEIQVKSRAFYFPPFENAYMVIEGKKYYIVPDNKIDSL